MLPPLASADIPQIDHTVLTGVVRQALGDATVELGPWNVTPLGYGVINLVTAGLYRVAGVAGNRGIARQWSVVLKILHLLPAKAGAHYNGSEDPAHWNYWEREALVYATDLLAGLPPGLAAPRCVGVTTHRPDTRWLWLEEVIGAPGTGWPVERFGRAAHHLGQMQGQYLAGRPLPGAAWLSRQWLRAWVSDDGDAVRAFVGNPEAHRIFPGRVVDAVPCLFADREMLLAAVERLPRTLCHFDFWPPNLFSRIGPEGDDQTVVLDWAGAGQGAPGEDVANLPMDSVWMQYIDAADLPELEHHVWQGYLAGLRAAGWVGDPRAIRLAYTAVAGLRFGLLAPSVVKLAEATDQHAEMERRHNRPIQAIIASRARVVSRALQLADEARILLSQ